MSGKREKSLRISVLEGCFASLMQIDQFLVPLAVALKSSPFLIGLIRAFPQLGSSVVQFFSPQLSEMIGSKKKIIVLSVLFQALSCALLVAVALFLRSPYLLVVAAILISTFGAVASPLWSAWMGDLTKERERGSYFSYRSKVTGVVAFFAILVFGVMISFFSDIGMEYVGFAAIFGIAMFSKLVSARLLSRIHEPIHKRSEEMNYGFRQFLGSFLSTNFGRFVLFMTLMAFAMNIASSFLSLYVLQDLHYDYLQYTIFTLVSVLISFLFVTYWGVKSDRHGNRAIFTITSIALPLMPLLWVATRNFYLITLIQAFGTFVWLGFSLSASNFIYDAVEPGNRTRVIAYYNVLNGLAVFGGTFLGGIILSIMPAPILFSSKFHDLFMISFIARMAVVLVFIRGIQEVRAVEKAADLEHRLFLKLIILDPMREMADNMMTNVNAAITVGKKGLSAATEVGNKVIFNDASKRKKRKGKS
ncbi:MFS transporter [Candidatus Woesearchaeota archaeon]|nr:MFS transporter [Candidatus Woesearchaeota archaeon]